MEFGTDKEPQYYLGPYSTMAPVTGALVAWGQDIACFEPTAYMNHVTGHGPPPRLESLRVLRINRKAAGQAMLQVKSYLDHGLRCLCLDG